MAAKGKKGAICGCFPTKQYYPGIAHLLDVSVEGLAKEFDSHMPWHDIPIAVIDFETTGFDPENDRVVEVGVVCFHRGEHTITHNWLVNPGRQITEDSIKVHGITEEMVAKEPKFDELAPQIIKALEGHLPAAYNAGFDKSFMLAEMGRAGMRGQMMPPALRPKVKWLDPLVWVREFQKEERSKKLGAVCGRLGINIEKAHRAWCDAEATGKVIVRLAEQMPERYSDMIRIQDQHEAQQHADRPDWQRRRN